jgi:hypothetical protein
MQAYKVGDRVALEKGALSLSYIAGRQFYTNMYEGKKGTVIGFTGGDNCASISNKVAIQFDDVVFTRPDGQISSHDNGCHGKGKRKYSWYVPGAFIKPLVEEDDAILLLMC